MTMEHGTSTENTSLRTAAVAAALFLMTCSFFLAKTGRDALYFQERGIFDLPKAYMGLALSALPAALLILALMRYLGPRPARIVAPVGMAAVLVYFSQVARPGGGLWMTILFASVPLAFGVLFSMSWLLGADILDRTPRSKLTKAYSIIGASSIVGGTTGGLLAKFLAPHFEPNAFLLFGAFVLLASAAVTAWAQFRFPFRSISDTHGRGRPEAGDILVIFRHRYTVALLFIAVAASLGGLLIDFQFYIVAAASDATGREKASFFANVYFILNAIALVVQLYVMPRLQKAIGVHGSLFILPGVLLAGSTLLLVSATMVTRSLLRIAEGGLKSSIHRSNWEQAYLPLTRVQRAVAKLVVDGAGVRMAEGLAAALLYVWLRTVIGDRDIAARDTLWIFYLLGGVSVLWLFLTRALQRSLVCACEAKGSEEEFRVDIPLPDT